MEHWRQTVNLVWDVERVVDSLERKFDGVIKILDCACGTGEFAIELAKRKTSMDVDFPAMGGLRKYEVDCSDGDKNMVEIARRQVEMCGLEMALDPKVIKWKDLDKRFEGNYDFVMMRGNSLVSINSWGNDTESLDYEINAERADREIIEAMRVIHGQLREGGVFYFDMRGQLEEPVNVPKTRRGFRTEHVFDKCIGAGKFEGKEARVTHEVKYFPRNNVRRIVSRITIGDFVDEQVFNSYLLPFEKVDYLLQEAGFKRGNIRCVALDGETLYTPYLVKK